LRVTGGGQVVEVDWPTLDRWPSYGLVRSRHDLDAGLAAHAVAAGARLVEEVTVTGPLLDDAGRVAGVQAVEGPGRTPATWRARLVVSAEGLSGGWPRRWACCGGRTGRSASPSAGTCPPRARTTRTSTSPLTSPPTAQRGLDARLRLGVRHGRRHEQRRLRPARHPPRHRRRAAGGAARVAGHPAAEWQLGEEHAVTPLRGAGLPMALHRGPAYTRGLLLAGDAAGTVNPFNGEGISYALETGRMAAEAAVEALAAPEGLPREGVLRRYPARLREEYGRHHRLGTGFLALLARPDLVRFATTHGLKRPALVARALRLMGNLSDGRDGDRFDRAVAVLTAWPRRSDVTVPHTTHRGER
jgi:flavin-dependent dehydrogenase